MSQEQHDPIRIKQAEPEDVDDIAPLFDAYRQFYQQPSDEERARLFLLERLQNQESVVFVAYLGDEAAGFTQLYPSFTSISLKRLWILNDLFVAPQARQNSVGSKLLERARQLAEQSGAAGLVLDTAVDNFSAQRLYERMGWKRETGFYQYSLKV